MQRFSTFSTLDFLKRYIYCVDILKFDFVCLIWDLIEIFHVESGNVQCMKSCEISKGVFWHQILKWYLKLFLLTVYWSTGYCLSSWYFHFHRLNQTDCRLYFMWSHCLFRCWLWEERTSLYLVNPCWGMWIIHGEFKNTHSHNMISCLLLGENFQKGYTLPICCLFLFLIILY